MVSTKPILKLEQIEKTYGTPTNPLCVLHGIDLRVEAGEYVAIVGPSGAGKSTLLHIVGCLDRPTSGSYFFMGDDVAGLDDHHLSQIRKTRIGFVFQSFQLISHLSVLENVEMPLFYARVPRRERHARCRELIDEGLKTLFAERFSGLAVSQQVVGQRGVVIEIAQHGTPDILVEAHTLDQYDGNGGWRFQVLIVGPTVIDAHRVGSPLIPAWGRIKLTPSEAGASV